MLTSADFEAVIGLEVHCQLATESKIFCSCPAGVPAASKTAQSISDLSPNESTCEICTGHPGTLPVLNQKVVEFAVKAGLATQCRINPTSVFARKNYFYPDLPKGYQITQYQEPICEHGWLEFNTEAEGVETQKTVSIHRIHIEEDAGKSVHMGGYSLVNLNRAGVPLIEIVSGPDLRSPQDAAAYLKGLHALVTYLEISDGNLEEGNFRCDANVSVRRQGDSRYGTRVEIKNVNSFRFVEKAIEFEVARQIELVLAGGRVVQETRSYDSARNVTVSMRSKEEAEDYRYFPDPDLVSVQLSSGWINAVQASLPELPQQKRKRFMDEFGLSAYDTGILISTKPLAEYFEEVLRVLALNKEVSWDLRIAAKSTANWIIGEVLRLVNEEGLKVDQCPIKVTEIAVMIQLLLDQIISSTGAKQVIAEMWKTGESVESIVEKHGLRQVSDRSALDPVIDQVLKTHPNQVAEYRAGKDKVLGFFVGTIMKEMGGKANPSLLGELLKKKIGPQS